MHDSHHARPGNLYEASDAPATGERFETLLSHRNLVIERIVSSSDTGPCEFVQAQDEWVLLARGTATLDIDGHAHHLKEGDHVFLPAGTPPPGAAPGLSHAAHAGPGGTTGEGPSGSCERAGWPGSGTLRDERGMAAIACL